MTIKVPGVLPSHEIVQRINAGQLIRNPRLKDGQPDVQPASYDLTAGRAVWTDSPSGETKELSYSSGGGEKPFAVLQPGQMMSIITHEEILMPADLCGTVFSKNRLALNGIFAFNAGHVDPGFEGPIVIRLINLRRNRYTVNLGEPIFTIVFQSLAKTDVPGDGNVRPAITMDETVRQVRSFADIALSNALFDLYADRIKQQLDDHRTEILAKLRADLGKDFVSKDRFGHFLLEWGWKKLLVIGGLVALILGILKNWGDVATKLHLR
jgi:deoxycytidine triphosphate deaminase